MSRLPNACPKKRAKKKEKKYTLKRSRIKTKPRSAAEDRRIYGSRERRRFVQALPCLVDGCHRYPLARQIVHVETGGMGRKADAANNTVPLCHFHHIQELHRIGIQSFESKYGINLKDEAARIEKLWQEYLAGGAGSSALRTEKGR